MLHFLDIHDRQTDGQNYSSIPPSCSRGGVYNYVHDTVVHGHTVGQRPFAGNKPLGCFQAKVVPNVTTMPVIGGCPGHLK